MVNLSQWNTFSSQPSTPRPGSPLPQSPSQEQRKENLQYPPQYPPNSPYAPGPIRKRRNDSIYQPEAGPYFSPTKTFGNLYATDRTTAYVKISFGSFSSLVF
jgi:hypothetical protein